MKSAIPALIIITLITSCTDNDDFITADLLAKSLNQRWFKIEIDKDTAQNGIGPTIIDHNGIVAGGGQITLSQPGTYYAMIQIHKNKEIDFFINGHGAGGRFHISHLKDMDLPVSAYADRQIIKLNEPIVSFGKKTASLDVIDEQSYQVIFTSR